MLPAYSCQPSQLLLSLSLIILLCPFSLIPPICFSIRSKEEPTISASLSIPERLVTPKPTETSGRNSSDSQNKRHLSKVLDTLPLTFEANQGQAQPQVKFISRGKGYNLLLTSTEAILCLRETSGPKAPGRLPNKKDDRLRQARLQMKLEGADTGSQVTGLEESEGKVNYLLGNKAEQWQTNIPLYAKVQYHNVYPGVDLIYYGNHRQIEHDFVIAPGADPHLIQLSFKGAEVMRLDAQHNLIFRIHGKPLSLFKPLLYQIIDGRKKDISGGYVLHKRHRVSFQVGSYDRTIPLVIDPVLVYSTYLGGESMDEGNDIAVDRAGNAYVTGWTWSAAFPSATSLTAPALGAIGGVYDAFVFKLSADGQTLLYRTYLGGSNIEHGLGIAVDNRGNAYITGWTSSTDFPVVNPLQSTNAGASASGSAEYNTDAFVTILNPLGSRILFSTYLGGSAGDTGSAIAIDDSGGAYITGTTNSSARSGGTPFPTVPGSFATMYNEGTYERGFSDAFVTKLNTNPVITCISVGGVGDCSAPYLVYSTYLGGNGADVGNGIAIDAAGSAYITGTTNSSNFPTVSPLQSRLGGGSCRNGSYTTECSDVFVTKLSADGRRLEYSTYIGGTGTDKGNGIAISDANHVYLTGETTGSFPTREAFSSAFGGGATEAFVTQLDEAGRHIASTYLGGAGNDKGASIAVDSGHNIYITGSSTSPNFPRANHLQSLIGSSGNCDTGTPGRWHPCTDAFITKLNPAGREMIYSTLLGGNKDDEGRGIAVDNSGNAYITGMSSSAEPGSFPTANPLQITLNGTDDVIVAKISDGVVVDPTRPPSSNLIADALEVTQAIQDLNNSIRLVAGKRTFVRFHVHSACASISARAKLTVQRGGTTTTLNPINPGASIIVLPSPVRGILNHAFLFELPSNMISEGGLTLTAEINPANLAGQRSPQESSFTDNSIQRSVSFQSVLPFNLTIMSVGYDVSGATNYPPNSHVDQLESWLRRTYPLSDLRVSHGTMDYIFGFTGAIGCEVLDAQLLAGWVWNHRHLVLIPVDMRYYGMVDDRGVFMRGCSFPGPVASGPTGTRTWGWDFDGSYGDWYGGHELGHAYGRAHVLGARPGGSQCGDEASPNTVHPNGRISQSLTGAGALFGFDAATRAVLPPTSGDFMSYCDNQWVSDFTHNGLFPPSIGRNALRDLYPLVASTKPFSFNPFSMDLSTPMPALDRFSGLQGSEDRLLVSGVIDSKSSKATLLPSFIVPNADKLIVRLPGNYSIILRDASGSELARYPFTPARLEGGPPMQTEPERSVDSFLITELVPYVEGTTQVDIAVGSNVIGSLKAGPAPPAVKLTSPNGGESFNGKTIKISWEASDEDKDPLSFHVFYSPDRGSSWRILASYVTGNSIELDTTNIPGSKDALFQVVASDGIHTVSDDSDDVFSVINHAPIARITSPDKNLVAVTGQTITFEATAFKDGATMPAKQLTWISDINGVLGNGERLSTADLKVGHHKIVFTADDGKGAVVADSLEVTVVEDWSKLPPVPDAVRAGPSLIIFNPAVGEVKSLVSIDNENSVPLSEKNSLNSLNWYATTDAPWLSLSATKGTTPDQIVVGFKDTGLAEGKHTSFITFINGISPTQNSTIRVQVTIGAKKGFQKPAK